MLESGSTLPHSKALRARGNTLPHSNAHRAKDSMLKRNEKEGIATFFTIWLGQTVSVIGSGLTNFGIGVWLFQKTGTVTTLAISMLAVTLPGVLMMPIAGALVDRWNRRTAMIVSNAGSGASSLILVLLVLAGRLDVWSVYALMAVSSAFSTLMWPAMTASISLLVPKEQLGRASGLQQASEAGSMLVSPVLGALLYAVSGLRYMVAIDVASFIFAILTLWMVNIPSPAATPAEEGKKQSFAREALYGFGYIRERKGLLGLLTFFLAMNFVGGILGPLWVPLILSMYPVAIFGKQTGPNMLGLLEAVMGIAFLVGTIAMTAWGGPKKKIYGIYMANGLTGAAMLIVLLSHNWYAIAGMGAIFMLLMPIGNGSSQAIWQRKVDPAVQGRVFAIRRMIAWCTTPLATLLAGPLADRVFGPAMMPAGPLAHVFPMLGPGPGAGIRLMIVFGGLSIMAMALAAYAAPHIRNVEDELPDAITEPPESINLPVSEIPVQEPLQAS